MKKPSKHKSKPGTKAGRGRRQPAVAAQPVAVPPRVPSPTRASSPDTALRAVASPTFARAPYSTAAHYAADDRQAIVLLLLPFLIMAFAIGMGHTFRPGGRWIDVTAPHEKPRPAVVETARAPAPAIPAPVAPATPSSETPSTAVLREFPAPALSLPATAPQIPIAPVETALVLPELRLPQAAPAMPTARVDIPAPTASLPLDAPAIAIPELRLAEPALRLPPAAPLLPAVEIALAAPSPALDRVAPPMPRGEITIPDTGLRLPPPAPDIAIPPASAPDGRTASKDASGNVCVADASLWKPRPAARAATPAIDPASFGVALAAAARAQTREFVIYNDKYRRLSYPMGDVSSFYGVCTDVLVRAYRALGIDLQELVQTTRSGSGDPNIDHRRVDTLRRFFAAHGEALPITDFAEDYRPGDIVSYWRPQNRHSRTHIAIVADEIGPSGKPMIIHNRGWGPQIEDGLFVDQITGHYRFTGLRNAKPPAVVASNGGQPRAALPVPAAGLAAAAKLNGAGPAKGNGTPTLKPRAQRGREARLPQPGQSPQ